MEPLPKAIEDIRTGIRAGRYAQNERAVSQGVVLPLLGALGWPAFDTQVVCPEYAAGNGRVDYALCPRPSRPACFIEVKRLGQSDGAEPQLFQYAFHRGVPLLILTDGRRWRFFLALAQGEYRDRLFYEADMLEDDPHALSAGLARYLGRKVVSDGSALDAAQEHHGALMREREASEALPEAWGRLLAGGDEAIVAALAREVEDICRYRPDADMVEAFLAEQALAAPPARPRAPARPAPAAAAPTPAPQGAIGFTLHGRFTRTSSATEAFIAILEALQDADPSFSTRFAAACQPRNKYRDFSLCAEDVPPAPRSRQIRGGYWLHVDLMNSRKVELSRKACQVAGLTYGRDVVLHLGDKG